MILMSIPSPLRQHQIRIDLPFQLLKSCLDFRALERQESISEFLQNNFTIATGCKKICRALGFIGPLSARCEDHPVQFETGVHLPQNKYRAAAPDLDIV